MGLVNQSEFDHGTKRLNVFCLVAQQGKEMMIHGFFQLLTSRKCGSARGRSLLDIFPYLAAMDYGVVITVVTVVVIVLWIKARLNKCSFKMLIAL